MNFTSGVNVSICTNIRPEICPLQLELYMTGCFGSLQSFNSIIFSNIRMTDSNNLTEEEWTFLKFEYILTLIKHLSKLYLLKSATKSSKIFSRWKQVFLSVDGKPRTRHTMFPSRSFILKPHKLPEVGLTWATIQQSYSLMACVVQLEGVHNKLDGLGGNKLGLKF